MGESSHPTRRVKGWGVAPGCGRVLHAIRSGGGSACGKHAQLQTVIPGSFTRPCRDCLRRPWVRAQRATALAGSGPATAPAGPEGPAGPARGHVDAAIILAELRQALADAEQLCDLLAETLDQLAGGEDT